MAFCSFIKSLLKIHPFYRNSLTPNGKKEKKKFILLSDQVLMLFSTLTLLNTLAKYLCAQSSQLGCNIVSRITCF